MTCNTLTSEPQNYGSGLLLRLLSRRRLLGFEKSFKMSAETLLTDRFLVGIEKKEMPQNALFVVCERLGLRDDQLTLMMDNLSGARVVHFGFEGNGNECFYKVYLEYSVDTLQKNNTIKGAIDPILLHLAFKWNPLIVSSCSQAQYIYYPRLSGVEICERLSRIYGDQLTQFSCKTAQELVNLTSALLNTDDLMYVEVTEQQNPRRSFDINLYHADLAVNDVEEFLFNMCREYSIPTWKFESFYEKIKRDRLGHLSGGTDRHGRDFFTVYYDQKRD